MIDWCMAHPWMTLIIAIGCLCVIEEIVKCICSAVIGEWYGVKYIEKDGNGHDQQDH